MFVGKTCILIDNYDDDDENCDCRINDGGLQDDCHDDYDYK